MKSHVRFPLGFVLSVMAATAAYARGPSPQPWLIYPVKSMDSCRAGTAPPQIAARCDELLGAYSRELEACVPMRRGGPVVGRGCAGRGGCRRQRGGPVAAWATA